VSRLEVEGEKAAGVVVEDVLTALPKPQNQPVRSGSCEIKFNLNNANIFYEM